MFNSYFTAEQLLSLLPGLVLILTSIFIFRTREQPRAALVLLFLGALALRIAFATLDPFINMWDEQYHALVAKNMMSDPFNPKLYAAPVHPVDFKFWTHNEIWIHKQPLFLWQIALSFKAFGVNELALRLPSVIMSAITVLFIYRMGKLSVNQRVGFYAALLWSLNFFGLSLVSGLVTCDHNDAAFAFYVTASLWAWTEYNHSGKRYWLILIGLFAGCGVLVKWLTAFLVFSGWGLTVLFDKEKRKRLRPYLDIAISVAIAVAVFLPWQLYILNKFPDIASYNYKLNSEHFTHAVHGHDGDVWYYWNNLKHLYGDFMLVPDLIVVCLVFLFIKMNRKYRVAYFTWIILIYTFFTIAATKMAGFAFPVSSLILIAIATGIDTFLTWMGTKMKRAVLYPVSVVFLLALCLFTFNVEGQQKYHTHWQDWIGYRKLRMAGKEMFEKLDKDLPAGNDKWVIFGCRSYDHIPAMFYTDHTVYDAVPDVAWVNDLIAKGYKVAAYDYQWMTDTIRNHPGVKMLKVIEIK